MIGAGDIEDSPHDAQHRTPPQGTSPYASGGGGVTFERRVAVQYLAHLLVGDGAPELGEERRVVSVAFQQAPAQPVDDLLVSAAYAAEREPSLVLAIGVRRAPNLVASDQPTQKLIRDFVRGVNATLLGSFLRALSGAAEESVSRADTARRLWPTIVARVLELNTSGQTLIDDDSYFGGITIAALLPNAAGEVSFLYPELDGDPIVWWRPLEWKNAVEQWLPVAAGNPSGVDHLISFLSPLSRDEQVQLGLSWVSALVLPDPEAVAGRSFLLSTWLIETRAAATDQGLLAVWQRVVDALVVAGVTRLAEYSE